MWATLCSGTLLGVFSACMPSSSGEVKAVPLQSGARIRHDDPRTCVEAPAAKELARPAWEQQLEARIDAALPTLAACAVREAGVRYATIALDYDERGKPRAQTLVRSTLTRCAVVDCLNKKLAAIEATSPAPDGEPYPLELEFEVGSPPRRAAAPYSSGPSPEQGCLNSTPNKAQTLPPAEIQRIVRDHYGLLRTCYEAGLTRDPNLQGGVSTRFVIERSGQVLDTRVQANTLPDCKVSHCVAAAFRNLRFPSGSRVTVVYPIQLSPG
jgi:hypothetical protein